MPFTSCIAIFRLVFIGSLCLLSVVHAHPASTNSPSETNPGSLLGRSYYHRVENPPILSRLAVGERPQQLDGHGPLDRADRFRVSQRRAVTAASPNHAGSRAIQDVETREEENLLSHEELPALPAPSAVNPNTILPASATPTSSSTTSTTTTVEATASHSTRLAEEHGKSSKKTTKEHAHDSHKGKKTIQYASQE
ncbi:hypothetical protein FB45DRAFT_940918 [Roridomyces roridus]|uniref:Uncharacterized protein n=1 Tax=Roridomyces roridus TaxID=1738132 RepID=A0AAD7B6U2_9AGAR|nr:hypothetical protein FB45DRAFT_940918 [Roridomyces roridus]